MGTKSMIKAALALCTLSGAGLAQVVHFDAIPDLEQPANRHQYYSSHNSYLYDNSLFVLLDVYNVWEIELDVRYVNDQQPNGLDRYKVFHHCYDSIFTDDPSLEELMEEIKTTNRFKHGIFFLNIELGEVDDPILGCDDWDDLTPINHDRNVDDILIQRLGLNNIYSNVDFIADGQVWPSIQELVRRGKHVIVHVRYQSPNYNAFTTDLKFLKRSAGLNETTLAFWNSGNENASFNDLGDKHMARYYPADSICEHIFEPGNWNDAINSGFNFPSTNCADEFDDFHEKRREFHPPYPMYTIPVPLPIPQQGTSGRPYHTAKFLQEIQTWIKHYNGLPPLSSSHTSRAGIIPVRMFPGTYSISTNGGVIDGPVVLQSSGGAFVTLN